MGIATLRKQTKITNNKQSDQTNNVYSKCFYEKIFSNTELRNRVGFVLLIYILLEIIFVFLCNKYDKILNADEYKMTAFVIGTTLFGPCVIIYNSKCFHKLYELLKPLLKDNEIKNNEWYSKNAKNIFKMFGKVSKKSVINIIINALCSFIILSVYFYLLIHSAKATILSAGMVYVSIYISAMCTILSRNNKNINIVLFIICCGLSYYVYLFKISSNSLLPLVNENYIIQSIIVIGLVIVLFFIAGTSIYPMYQSFKLFYLSNFEEKLIYPIKNLTVASEKIYAIKKYFLQLTITSLIAYFQLFLSAYSLGIIRKESILTITLFIIVSFIPLIMFLASNIFFKNLCQKVRIRHIDKTNLDEEILKCVSNEHIDTNKVSALLSIREAYGKTILTGITINPEVFAAMLSPIVTTVLAVICKIKI